MKVRVLILFTTLLLAACATTPKSQPQWGYRMGVKPAQWGQYYSACRAGGEQSPIDIPRQIWRNDELKPLQFQFSGTAQQISNDGHSFTVSFDDPTNRLLVNGDSYLLQQMQVHIPAENYVTGQKYPMEWQLLYQNTKGQLVIVAILAEMGRSNSEVAKLAARLPALNRNTSLNGANLNLSNLLPPSRNYYSFNGSLTMPPCTRDVQWYLLKMPITVSLGQLNSFREHFRSNSRPLQSLNGRKVQTNG